jgi:hypothetical protein
MHHRAARRRGFRIETDFRVKHSCRAAGLCRQWLRHPGVLAAGACRPTAIFTPRLLRLHFHYAETQLPVLLDLSIASRIS